MSDAPHNGTATSEAAAEQVQDAKTLRERVFNAIQAAGDNGMTDEEIQTSLGMDGNTERPRRWELSHKSNRIRKVGTRRTQSGRAAVIWVASA